MSIAHARMRPFHARVTLPSRHLPPFAGLVAFDAVLRHGSMTRAADELGLTQSAVSHRLRALEAHFGTPLLIRLNPGLRATVAGERLARELAPTLRTLGGLRARIVDAEDKRPFRIGVGGALLAWWLSPRLPALAAAFPDHAIEVVTWDVGARPAASESDLTLHWLPRATLTREPDACVFPTETVFPVAAPKLRRTCEDGEWQRGLPLLAKGRPGDAIPPEWSWATWLGAEGDRPAALHFRGIGDTLQAALDGTGVALGRSLLIADAVRRRRLTRLVPRRQGLPCSKVQVARWRGQDRSAARMAAWIAAAAEETVGTTRR